MSNLSEAVLRGDLRNPGFCFADFDLFSVTAVAAHQVVVVAFILAQTEHRYAIVHAQDIDDIHLSQCLQIAVDRR